MRIFTRLNRIVSATMLIASVVYGYAAHAALEIDITKGNIDPLPIALADLQGTNDKETRMGQEIMQVVANDLTGSGLFRMINKSAFIETSIAPNTLPHYASWRQVNAAGLVTGTITFPQGNKVTVDFRLWDVYSEQQIAGISYTASTLDWRRVAHIIADKVYQRLTGEDGYFDTRIVYIAEKGPANRRVKQLAIMDQDGANHQFLTKGAELVLTPRFSPSMQQVIYMSYIGNKPRVYIYDLDTGRQRILGDFPGMSFAPRFSPKGDRAIMSVASNGNTEIYVLDIKSGRKKQITFDRAIDTSPSFSPDEKRIVFNSDRGGTQQLYTMNEDGSNAQRISFGEGRYGTPVWSPRGDLIAFTKILKGKFYIGVMKPDGSGERVLTGSYLDEGPTWSPNGRVLMFTRQETGGRSRIYSIDLTGYHLRERVTPLDASDPAWSPLL